METKENLSRRLSKIEGQVKGISKMVAQGSPCEDILTQISAASSALNGVACKVMENHIEHCVKDGIQCGAHDQTVSSLIAAFERFSKLK